MARLRAHSAFGVLMALYFLTRYLRLEWAELPNFFRFHFTDLLFVPAMSLFSLIVIRFFKRDPSLTIPWQSVAIQVVLVSFYFEWYLPNNSPEGHVHISDAVDCLMYGLGGLIFLGWQYRSKA
jgi:hypothetical protein